MRRILDRLSAPLRQSHRVGIVGLLGAVLGLGGCVAVKGSPNPPTNMDTDSARIAPKDTALETARFDPPLPPDDGWTATPVTPRAEKDTANRNDKSDSKTSKKDPIPAPLVNTPPAIPDPMQTVSMDLPAALGLAGAENPTIAIANEAVRVALAEQFQACALLVPTLNAGLNFDYHAGATQPSFGAIRELNRQSFYIGAGSGAVVAGTVAYPGVRIFSPLADAIFEPRAAKQEVVTRQFEARATHNSILLDVGVRYYALVGAEGRLAVIRESEQEFGELARLTAERARAGQARPPDADRALAEALELHQQEIQAEEGVAVASAELTQLLNLDPSARLHANGGPVQLLDLVNLSQSLETLLDVAVRNRPEMGARSATIMEREVRYRQERVRPFLPTLSAGYSAGGFGGGGNLAPPTSASFNTRTDLDVYAFWTLKNLGLGNVALQRERRAEINEAVAERSRTVNTIRDEVAEALATANAQLRTMGVARRKLERALLGYERDLRRVRGLEGRAIEVLNSARLLSSARQEFVLALMRYNQSQLRLFVALGQPPEVVSTAGGNRALSGPDE
jgi:outer membrane protein TolC